MGLRIKTNTASVNAQRHLEKATSAVQESMTKLSSGSRINKSADDAAGLAVSESLRADLRSLEVAKRNASDGISLIQVAEGGLEETNNMLIRLRELAIQSASDTLSNRERAYLDQEFVQLKDEINRIAASTEFNGTRLLIGETGVPEDMKGMANPFPLEIQVNKDYFVDSDGLDKNNPVNIIRIDLSQLNAFTYGENSLNLGDHEDGARVTDKVNAQQSIAAIDHAITRVSEHRAYLGAVQNRMGSTINNLGMQIQGLTESRSRITDTDFAVETANFTKANILQQAGTSILASANALPKVALSLLQG